MPLVFGGGLLGSDRSMRLWRLISVRGLCSGNGCFKAEVQKTKFRTLSFKTTLPENRQGNYVSKIAQTQKF